MGTRIAVVIAVLSLLGCTRERIVYRDNPVAPGPVEATPAPVPPSLRFPQDVPESQIIVVPGVPKLTEAINAEIRAMFPDCNEGADRCDGHGYDPQSYFAVLTSRLRARGYWAGQHRDGVSDEITVATDCKGEWENYHAWAYDGYPIWARVVNAPCAGEACLRQSTSYRGNTIIPAEYCR